MIQNIKKRLMEQYIMRSTNKEEYWMGVPVSAMRDGLLERLEKLEPEAVKEWQRLLQQNAPHTSR